MNTAFLTDTGTKAGDSYTLTSGGRRLTVQIAGEVFDPGGGRAGMPSPASPPWPRSIRALSPDQYDVALTQATDAQAYADAVGAKLALPYQVSTNGGTPHSSSSSSAWSRR